MDQPTISGAVMEKKKKYDDWDIRNWADKLQEAEEIKNDPEKMKLLQPHLKKKIKSIEDLKDLISKKMDDGSMDE